VKAWIEVHMHQRRAADAYAHARAHARAHAQRVHVVHASQVRHAEHGYTYYGYMSMAIPSTAILTMATPTRRTMPTTSPSRRCGTTRTTALTTPPSSRRIRTCLGGCTTRHAAYPPLPTPPPTPTPCTHPTLHARHAPLFTPARALTRAQLTECLPILGARDGRCPRCDARRAAARVLPPPAAGMCTMHTMCMCTACPCPCPCPCAPHGMCMCTMCMCMCMYLACVPHARLPPAAQRHMHCMGTACALHVHACCRWPCCGGRCHRCRCLGREAATAQTAQAVRAPPAPMRLRPARRARRARGGDSSLSCWGCAPLRLASSSDSSPSATR
jgi:hypothetical protein